MKKNILTFCMALSCAFFTVSPHASAEEHGWLGVNLDGLADYSSTETFNDAMKSSRRWGRPREPWKHEVKTDELGWPTEDAGVIVDKLKELYLTAMKSSNVKNFVFRWPGRRRTVAWLRDNQRSVNRCGGPQPCDYHCPQGQIHADDQLHENKRRRAECDARP